MMMSAWDVSVGQPGQVFRLDWTSRSDGSRKEESPGSLGEGLGLSCV